jgi:hypothetical protein
MQDRPTVDELLEAVSNFLKDDVMPATQGRINFHARVASNAIEIVRRELAGEEEHLGREWDGLDALLGEQELPASLAAIRSGIVGRNQALVELIKNGDADSGQIRDQVYQHLRATTVDKLAVTNPRWLER